MFTLSKKYLFNLDVCAITSPHKLPARGYFIDEYYFLSTPCLSALNELSDSIQISPSRKTSMVCCMDYYTTAFKWAFFVESSIKPIVCVRPYDFSRCCDAQCCVEFWRVSYPCNDTQNPRVFSLQCSMKSKSLWNDKHIFILLQYLSRVIVRSISEM